MASKPQMAPQGGSKDKNSNQANNIMNYVGMVVNGFEIMKLIGKFKEFVFLIIFI